MSSADEVSRKGSSATALPPPAIVIKPPAGRVALNLGDVWRYHDLLWLLVWRDFCGRYRQSILGIGWAVIRPVLTALVFTVIFGYVAQLPSDGIPYPLFSFSALLPWTYFSGCLTASTNSVVFGSTLITKVYFPRLVLPISSVIVGLVDFAIQFVILIGLLFWYGFVPTWGLLLVPLFLLQCVAAALSVGFWLTALNVKYRDVGHLVPFLAQIWMYLTPIVYASSMIPEKWRMVYALNPMVGVVDGFRWAVLGQVSPDWTMMAVSTSVVVLLLVSGLYFFRKMEETFADLI